MYNLPCTTMYNFYFVILFFVICFSFPEGDWMGALDYFISFCQHLRRFTISGFSGFHCDSSFTFDSN